MGKFKRLKYFDAALQRTLEATVMKTFTESLNAMDLSIYSEHPVKDWKSVFCMEHEEALKQEIVKILYKLNGRTSAQFISQQDDDRYTVYV